MMSEKVKNGVWECHDFDWGDFPVIDKETEFVNSVGMRMVPVEHPQMFYHEAVFYRRRACKAGFI